MTLDITKAAAALGKKGGKSKSDRKTTASRENGKKGGRPKLRRGEKMKIKIGRWSLENDVDCKIIPRGFEIFPYAVKEFNINPTSIRKAEGKKVSADWSGMGSIEVNFIS